MKNQSGNLIGNATESASKSKPKLFVSFTGTMCAFDGGRVNETDLDSGLFVFGCTREHAMTPGAKGEYVESIVHERPELHNHLVAALLKAEAEGRVRWRTTEDRNASFEMVNELLAANGFSPLISHEEYAAGCTSLGTNYCYPAVEKRSKELEVIWHN